MSSVHADGDTDGANAMARQSVVDSLEAFAEADDFKKLALEVIAFSTPPAKLKQLREMFIKIDVDDSGTISMDEFKKAMALHPEVPQDRVEQIYSQMDIDGSGEVDYSEFLSATMNAHSELAANAGSVMAAFTTLDKDKDGYITEADLEIALEGQVGKEAIKEMLSEEKGVADSQGRVNYQTFKDMMMKGLRRASTMESASLSTEEAEDEEHVVVKAIRKSVYHHMPPNIEA